MWRSYPDSRREGRDSRPVLTAAVYTVAGLSDLSREVEKPG